jgi:SAM-dependent methyltransferase
MRSDVVTVAEFRRRFQAGALSLETWDRTSLAPSEFRSLGGDPHSEAYAADVDALWRALDGRDEYQAERDEVFHLDLDQFLARPFPYSSGDPATVAHYLGAVAATIGALNAPTGSRIIEYGSGWGHMALALSSTGYDVTAVDLNPDSVDLLRRRAAALGVPLRVIQSGFLEFDPDAPVDAIVFFEAFHHCAKPFQLLDRCAAQLRPGGRLLFVAEAVYDDFYTPWGVRLDGAATFMTAQNGWLELGFRRDFFTAELECRGFSVAWETLPWLGAYGTLMTAILD